MPEFSVLTQWINQHPKIGWFWVFPLIYIFIDVVRHRAINAESGSIFRGLLNYKQRQLEQMLTQPYLDEKVVKLVKLELRQRGLYRLTGLYNYRLQNLSVIISDRYGLKATYLKPWRNWLKECDGQINFSRKWHRFCWYFFLVSQIFNGGLLIAFIEFILPHATAEMRTPLMMIFMLAWWLPCLLITVVPTPGQTHEMESYLEKFNSEQITVEE